MASSLSIDEKISRLNQRLKVAHLGLQVERRGKKLCLRGTLPPKPGSNRLRPFQQRLSLGLPATASGLRQIEQEAKVIAAQLIQNTFSWQAYLTHAGGKRLSQMDLAEQIEAFHQDFQVRSRQKHEHPAQAASTQTTWETAYAPYLRRLARTLAAQRNRNLTEAIYATVESIPVNSRGRQVCCTALGAFANFLHIDLPQDLKDFWGSYGTGRTQPRQLPTDEQILACFEQIPNPAWQFVYGIMATYGLRNHEVFFCDYSALAENQGQSAIEVLETTKTGHHTVWPFYPEWIETFNLRQVRLPNITTDLSRTTLQRIGQTVSTQFRRYELPFTPYDLRHAWAVRTIHFGLSDTVAARMMGHSVAIHTRTYHRWITHRDQERAVTLAWEKNKSSVS
jgi:hypothetical protein